MNGDDALCSGNGSNGGDGDGTSLESTLAVLLTKGAQVKVQRKGEVFRWRLTPVLATVQGLKSKICKAFHFSNPSDFHITWVDQEDDTITIGDDDDEIVIALSEADAQGHIAKFTVKEKQRIINSRAQQHLSRPSMAQPQHCSLRTVSSSKEDLLPLDAASRTTSSKMAPAPAPSPLTRCNRLRPRGVAPLFRSSKGAASADAAANITTPGPRRTVAACHARFAAQGPAKRSHTVPLESRTSMSKYLEYKRKYEERRKAAGPTYSPLDDPSGPSSMLLSKCPFNDLCEPPTPMTPEEEYACTKVCRTISSPRVSSEESVDSIEEILSRNSTPVEIVFPGQGPNGTDLVRQGYAPNLPSTCESRVCRQASSCHPIESDGEDDDEDEDGDQNDDDEDDSGDDGFDIVESSDAVEGAENGDGAVDDTVPSRASAATTAKPQQAGLLDFLFGTSSKPAASLALPVSAEDSDSDSEDGDDEEEEDDQDHEKHEEEEGAGEDTVAELVDLADVVASSGQNGDEEEVEETETDTRESTPPTVGDAERVLASVVSGFPKPPETTPSTTVLQRTIDVRGKSAAEVQMLLEATRSNLERQLGLACTASIEYVPPESATCDAEFQLHVPVTEPVAATTTTTTTTPSAEDADADTAERDALASVSIFSDEEEGEEEGDATAGEHIDEPVFDEPEAVPTTTPAPAVPANVFPPQYPMAHTYPTTPVPPFMQQQQQQQYALPSEAMLHWPGEAPATSPVTTSTTTTTTSMHPHNPLNLRYPNQVHTLRQMGFSQADQYLDAILASHGGDLNSSMDFMFRQ